MSRCTLDPTIVISDFAYGAFTLSGWLSQNHSAIRHESIIVVLTPGCTHPGLGSFPFARRYSENRCFFLFLRLLRCFSSPRSLLCSYVFTAGYMDIAPCGFPHSDICGSQDMCSSPQLIAAYHVFRRLSVPRHPPYALYSLTC